ncbi:MAG: hypothetical protein JRI23_06645 [Deltaproteobacteria bacterium]|nr:hypothetical protein [Deltaproteobacteria bacterium]
MTAQILLAGAFRNMKRIEQAFSTITPTSNHLWHLVYLLAYILIALLLLPRNPGARGPRRRQPG